MAVEEESVGVGSDDGAGSNNAVSGEDEAVSAAGGVEEAVSGVEEAIAGVDVADRIGLNPALRSRACRPALSTQTSST
ncbi:MAG: hypothetical protein AAB870_03015, partial [Patescibacteria group bacterium]